MTETLEREKVIERPPEVPKEPPPTPPRMFRWLAWVVGFAVLVGLAGLTYWLVSDEDEVAEEPIAVEEEAPAEVIVPRAPQLEEISPYLNPEVFGVTQSPPRVFIPLAVRELMDVGDVATQPYLPSLANISPYLNPEVFGVTQAPPPVIIPLEVRELMDVGDVVTQPHVPRLEEISPYLNPEVFGVTQTISAAAP
jgi:hypothetical protein